MRAPAFVAVWLCATAAAVGVSWLGVRTVVQDAVRPAAQLAVPAGTVPTGTPPPTPSGPAAPSVTTTPTSTTARTPTTTTTSSPSTSANGNVQRFTVRGGQVVLDLGASAATLVSATPADGYAVQMWQENGWLRVDFSAGNHTSSVFATWNGHPPAVQTFES